MLCCVLQAWKKLEELRHINPSVNVSVYVSQRSLEDLQNSIGIQLIQTNRTPLNTHHHKDTKHTHSNDEEEVEIEEEDHLND